MPMKECEAGKGGPDRIPSWAQNAYTDDQRRPCYKETLEQCSKECRRCRKFKIKCSGGRLAKTCIKYLLLQKQVIPKGNGLKLQSIFIISQFLWAKNLKVT